MTRAQHLSIVIGLFGVWHLLRYLCSVTQYLDMLTQFSNLLYFLAVLVIEPVLLTAVVVGRHRWAALLLRAEASQPVRQARALVIGGLILMGADLVERGLWQIWGHTGRAGLELATRISAPSVLAGAVLLLFARPIATLCTGER